MSAESKEGVTSRFTVDRSRDNGGGRLQEYCLADLYWLPRDPLWSQRLAEAKAGGRGAWPTFVALAKSALDLAQTERLRRVVAKIFQTEPPDGLAAPVVRLALLGSCTLNHLVPSIQVAAMRRNMWVEVFLGDYGQYRADLAHSEELRAFAPQSILLSLDARHLVASLMAAGAQHGVERALGSVTDVWDFARSLGAQIIQQDAIPVFPPLLGGNEHRLGWSPRTLVRRFNELLPAEADRAGVDVLSLARSIEHDGIAQWYDPGLWHRSKQEVHPGAAPVYGDLVARSLMARAGRSAKCMVLDLDNTLWGGVVGDDGLHGIVLGQGNPVGEAHLALQKYASDLSRRGIILAVCSKNDEHNALEPFDKLAEMILKRGDIACFVANWQDKPANLRHIAQTLNIGLDSLVFVDDNPFERNIVRRELPMVEIPELGEDPSYYVQTIADGGYFESVGVTADDEARGAQYQANAEREAVRASSTDLNAYLQSLDMKLWYRPIDKISLARVTQLINKSNQFNLTTRRYSEAEVEELIDNPAAISLQLRLVDSFGDNGMISVVICRPGDDGCAEIDTWLMSCRVLGRGVEAAALNLLVAQARTDGVRRLIGRYLPTAKNKMVADHYAKLGFTEVDRGDDGRSVWSLDLSEFEERPVMMETERG